MTHALLPSGFHDRLPPYADAAARLERRVFDAAGSHGYERVDPPLAEFEAALAHRLKSARAQDSVRFVDPISQRGLAIRPDITAQVGRIAATRMGHHPRPVRLSYAGSVLRLRASQLSPERERRQAGCELIGLDTVAAAQEIVLVAVEALEAAGVQGISIDFTLPDLLAALSEGPLPLGNVSLEELADRLDAKDAGAVAALAPHYLPLIEAAGPFEAAHDRLCRFDVGGALRSRLDGLWKVAETVKGRVALTLDPTERHGFEYQTWLGFSLFADGARGEIGRGGSYTIVHENGAEESAIGFTLYIDALAAGLPEDERRRLFVPIGTDPELAAKLRGEGWVTVAALEAGDTPEAQLCTHVIADGEVRTLAE